MVTPIALKICFVVNVMRPHVTFQSFQLQHGVQMPCVSAVTDRGARRFCVQHYLPCYTHTLSVLPLGTSPAPSAAWNPPSTMARTEQPAVDFFRQDATLSDLFGEKKGLALVEDIWIHYQAWVMFNIAMSKESKET